MMGGFDTETFRKLRREHDDATAHHSSMSIILSHPSFLAAVAMGPDAIPAFAAELSDYDECRWSTFYALAALTRTWPEDYEVGRFDSIRRAWLRWCAEHGVSTSSG